MPTRADLRARGRWAAGAAALLAALLAVAGCGSGGQSTPAALATNPYVDPGTPLGGRAPDFTLVDEAGRRTSLHQFRGRAVLLAFNDSECTTICPLTTTEMLQAKRMLGRAGARLQLLGIDANPQATSLRDVRAYTLLHGLAGRWRFLTGSVDQLRGVWRAYHIEAQIDHGEIDHTPAVYLIAPDGTLAKVYETQQSYTSVGQQAQVFAHDAAAVLPGRPRVRSDLSYERVALVRPTDSARLPRVGGGEVALGPGSAHLLLFFATWDRQTTDLATRLRRLAAWGGPGLPPLVAVDQTPVEPSRGAVQRFVGPLRLPYPVALDVSGRVADGYGVGDSPWLALAGADGRVLWHWDVATQGWPTMSALARQVRSALAHVPSAPTSPAAAARALVGSPPALAALHAQAGRLLGGGSGALQARLRALRGHPVVLNAWASWCSPCREEFALFASAGTRYGRRVAFVGADTNDSAGGARSFLASHPISYPSYATSTSDLNSLAPIEGLPTTIFLDPAGKVAYVHIGQYDSQGSLDGDIRAHALG